MLFKNERQRKAVMSKLNDRQLMPNGRKQSNTHMKNEIKNTMLLKQNTADEIITHMKNKTPPGVTFHLERNQAYFLTPDGDFVGGYGKEHDDMIKEIQHKIGFDIDKETGTWTEKMHPFLKKTGLIRVRTGKIGSINKDEIDLDIVGNITKRQIREILDMQKNGKTIMADIQSDNGDYLGTDDLRSILEFAQNHQMII